MLLIVSSVFPPEPVVSATIGFELAVALSEKYEVTVVTPKPTRPQGFSHDSNTPEKSVFMHVILDSYTYPASRLFGRMRESMSFGKHVAKFIAENQHNIECIYVHSWPLFGLFKIIQTARRFNLPTVNHVVDIYPEALSGKLPFLSEFIKRVLLPIDKMALRHSTRIVTISPKMKQYLEASRKLKTQNVEVVYNWQDENRFVQIQEIKREYQPDQPFTFMFLGNLNRTAAIHILIAAFAKCKLINARLIIAGNGSQKETLESLARDYKESNIDFWEAPKQNVPEIQAKADILLLSLMKGTGQFALPSKLPSYMFSGKPIIASVDQESDTAETIRSAGCGWIVVPEDTEALCNVMKLAAAIPKEELYNSGKNGYKYALANFSRAENLQKFVSIIESSIYR